ncbi:oligosaccharide repeat unit polymerase [Deinococcus actinosclerus]|uniref:oligosaccharide repeat unit polymerase n=1 Tax=Deinococcus actinosclerus TaxID=1768108 RepID=UPI0009E90D4A|nr:oligosaccharide repeat unit polymerase [Deinococcus actinosclerus]
MRVIRPHTIAIALCLILIGFSLINPNDYSIKIGEINYMYKNLNYYSYMILCTLVFCLGSVFSAIIFKRYKYEYFNPNKMVILSIGSIGITISLVKMLFLYLNFGFSKIFASYGGTEAGYLVKDDLNEVIAGGKIGWITDASIIVLIVLIWLSVNKKDKYAKLLLLANLLLFILISLISLSRDAIISVIISYIFIYLSSISGGVFRVLKKYIISILAAATLFAAFFVIVDSARNGLDRTNETITQIYGYFPASVNRGAAIYDGELVYPNHNSGYYSTQFIWDFPILSSALKLPQIARSYGLNIPLRPEDNWTNQFKAVRSYGLNQKYIWATIFGFVYADFGNLGVIYFLIYGILCGLFYRLYKSGSVFGIIMYTFSVITIAKWGSIISFSQRTILIGLIIAFLLHMVTVIKIKTKRVV